MGRLYSKKAEGEFIPARRSSSSSLSSRSALLDEDAERLAAADYPQDMQRNFSVLSVLGVGFSLTNSWFGISTALVAGIDSGGPVLIVYGIILLALISACIGVSLSELASAMPNAGGQYFWTSELAPKRYARFASYLTGWFAWVGSIFTSASVALGLASALVGCWQLSHPEFVINPWHVFVVYQMVNWTCFVFNCYGKALPRIATLTLYFSLASFLIILVVVPAMAPTHRDVKFVFATFINNTGWSNNGIAFIVGLVNTNWAFGCLDCATHLAEEVDRPERVIPIAIMGTVAIGFVTSWCYSVSMFFSIVGDFQEIVNTATGVPILALFYNALSNTVGAIFLETLIICTGFGCLIASHTWQSRLCWSFARDGGVPASKYLSHINKRLDVPLRAHLVSSVIVAIVGGLYLGSYTAFNSMATACIVLLYVSYSIPIICLLMRGRSKALTGPFNLGAFGFMSNLVLLSWTLFTIVMYSLPYRIPVSADNMNYVSAVYGSVVIIITADWFTRGRRVYRCHDGKLSEADEALLHRDGVPVE